LICRAMSEALAELMRQMSPAITPRDVAELPLLTLGGQPIAQPGRVRQIGPRVAWDQVPRDDPVMGAHSFGPVRAAGTRLVIRARPPHHPTGCHGECHGQPKS
jgi:hypothetical protein